MSKFIAAGLAFFAFASVFGVSAARASEPSRYPGLDAIVASRISEELFVDGAAGVVNAGQSGVYSFGRARPDSLFEIGSVTKTFTAIAFATLVNEHRIDPASALETVLPELRGTFAGSVTFHELAIHHSGLPSVPNDLDPASLTPYSGYSWPKLVRFLKKVKAPQDSARPYPYAYSNIGFSLLGRAVATVANEPYETVIRNRIALPLGMWDTTFDPNREQRRRFVDGHDPALGKIPHWDAMTVFAPTGALRSTANDMLRFVAANVKPDGSPLGRAIALTQSQGWGWDSEGFGFKFPYKNGQTGGFGSALIIIPERAFGAIVLTNIAYGADRLSWAIANPANVDPPEFAVPVTTLDAYVGMYAGTIGGRRYRIRVSRPRNHLAADLTGFNDGHVHLRGNSATEFAIVDASEELMAANGKFIFDGQGSLVLRTGAEAPFQDVTFRRVR